MYDCRYWLWLSLIFEPGSLKCDALLHAFDYNPKAIYEAERSAYEPICGKNLRLINALCDKSLDRVYEVLKFCEENNVGLLTRDDPKYPSHLLKIQGQPPVLYYKGTIPDFKNKLSIAMVGTRQVTSYGSSAAYTIAHDVAAAGAIVVSGMALGTDTAAHRGALDAKGITVAFLGCGIDRVYPKENESLMNEIIKSGAVMTDYPPGARPEGRHFPVRNRLISGVCHGVLIVEAAKKSGALITAEHALKQGRLIYAIPGRIGELNSEGTNYLLSRGAKTVTKSYDILADFRTLFGIKSVDNPSGYTQHRMKPADDLKTPYNTPTFNPYANPTKNYSERNGKKNFYDHFMPLPPEKKEEPKPEPVEEFKLPLPKKQTPRYIDLNKTGNQGSPKSFHSPKPIIVFSEFDDDEHAKAFMSLTDEEKAELEDIDMLAHRPVLKYREDPMPPGGYKIELTPEKIAKYERMSNELDQMRLDTSVSLKPKPVFDCITDLVELRKLAEKDKEIHLQRQKLREEARAKGLVDYTGLSSVEIKVLKVLEGGERLTVDSMSHLGIPLTKLLSVLTVLEIKHRIIQHPGGYFEINRDY